MCYAKNLHGTVATKQKCGRKFLHQSLAFSWSCALCNKNYDNPSIFVITMKKSVAPSLLRRGVYYRNNQPNYKTNKSNDTYKHWLTYSSKTKCNKTKAWFRGGRRLCHPARKQIRLILRLSEANSLSTDDTVVMSVSVSRRVVLS